MARKAGLYATHVAAAARGRACRRRFAARRRTETRVPSPAAASAECRKCFATDGHRAVARRLAAPAGGLRKTLPRSRRTSGDGDLRPARCASWTATATEEW